LVGCASGGNDVLRTQDAATVDRYVVDGKTTRSEVEKIYGPPSATSFADAQNDIWIYRWGRATAKPENFVPYVGTFMGGSNLQQKELVILFNAQSVVVRHSMHSTGKCIATSVFGGPDRERRADFTSPAPQAPAGAWPGPAEVPPLQPRRSASSGLCGRPPAHRAAARHRPSSWR
jgi:hypothetical protein